MFFDGIAVLVIAFFAALGMVEAAEWLLKNPLRKKIKHRIFVVAKVSSVAEEDIEPALRSILAETDGVPHNTITPIARKRDNNYELDLVLRNNITTEECPLGVYHPHSELHHIKKENIGLIEVMGLAVLPSRLKGEMEILADTIINNGVEAVRKNEAIAKHADWAEEFVSRNNVTAENIHDIIRSEIGAVFSKVLEHSGVYKRNEEGMAAFDRFISSLD